MKSILHFICRCLYELGWTKEALECLNYFKAKFPDYAKSHACETLDRDIKAAIFSRTENGMSQKPLEPSISIGLNSRMTIIKQLHKVLSSVETYKSVLFCRWR